MAQTPVTFKISGKPDREVQKVFYEFDQAVDVEGQIAGLPRGGKVTLVLKALNDGSPELCAWMVDKTANYSGTIEFNDTKSGVKEKEIAFEQAYCVEYEEHWGDAEGHTETVVLTCKNLSVGNAKYENPWK